MGGELLATESQVSDRVLVVFTDGEAHDSLAPSLAAAERLREAGVHLIFVAEGGRDPARIPRRDDQGVLQGYQVEDNGQLIETRRRDDVLITVADAARGTIIEAGLPDQAGAIRDLVASYKRSRATETSTQSGRPRGWIPLLAGVLVLFAQGLTRRTAALVGLCFALGGAAVRADAQTPPPAHRRSPAERAWDRGDSAQARAAYLAELAARGDDTAWYNAGTAAIAAGDFATARSALAHAAASLDPAVRFRALYNEGLLALRAAQQDTVHRDAHLGEAERAYREALLLRPHHLGAKWNLELAQRRRTQGGGSGRPPPSQGQGGPSQTGRQPPPPTSGQGMSQAQADEILRSIGQEELRTRRERLGRVRRGAEPGVKDW
jgi:tetratricopeptide (TPR) repeat protein